MKREKELAMTHTLSFVDMDIKTCVIGSCDQELSISIFNRGLDCVRWWRKTSTLVRKQRQDTQSRYVNKDKTHRIETQGPSTKNNQKYRTRQDTQNRNTRPLHKKLSDTLPSHVVPHHSTARA